MYACVNFINCMKNYLLKNLKTLTKHAHIYYVIDIKQKTTEMYSLL